MTSRTTKQQYDVVIVGGGAAGLSAGVFTARADLQTIVFTRGRSAIEQCAHLQNYLGFPSGIEPTTFLELGRTHAADEGCQIETERVESVERTTDGFHVETVEGRAVTATRVIAASVYDDEYLPNDEALFTDGFVATTDDGGRTIIDGLYAAGRLTGVAHQAIISAGNGARVGVAVVRDFHRDRGYWDEIADYRDWLVPDGKYGGEEWKEHVEEWVDGTIPAEKSIDPKRVERIREDHIQRRLDRQITEDERKRRVERGKELLWECLEES